MQKYSVLPLTLYRLQAKPMPQFRQKSQLLSKNLTSYDFKLGQNKLYNPIEGDTYLRPNGLTMRPIGFTLAEFFSSFKGKCIYELPKDLVLPKQFVVIRENSEHYSLQTTEPIQPDLFCKRVMEFLEGQKKMTKAELGQKVDQFLKKH